MASQQTKVRRSAGLLGGVAFLMLAACSAGTGDGEAQTSETLVGRQSLWPTYHEEGIVVRRPDGVCPRLYVDRVWLPSMTSTEYVRRLHCHFGEWSSVIGEIPQILGEAYPNALRDSPRYCVYEQSGATTKVPVADLAAAAAAQCGGACTITTLYFPNEVTYPGGHGCTSCY